jgi:hypothetical protein
VTAHCARAATGGLPCIVLGAALALVAAPAAAQQRYVPGQPVPEGTQPPPEYEYQAGTVIAEGYRLEHRPTKGLVLTGYLVTGIPYGIGVMVGTVNDFDNQSGWLLLPVAGPWLTLAKRERACNMIGDSGLDSPRCFADRSAEWMLGIDGVIQAIGGTFLVLGYAITTPWAVRGEVATQITVAPLRLADGYGLQLYGRM